MPRHEDDREDLMREAVALPDRVELSVDGFNELITIGFRANAAMSIFFGQDPVYQFDPEGRLRRSFVDGLLYRSQHSTLARLRRERSETQTLLLRTDLDDAELQEFRTAMCKLLKLLEQKLASGEFKIIRCLPESADHMSRIRSTLGMILPAAPWLSPAIRRRN